MCRLRLGGCGLLEREKANRKTISFQFLVPGFQLTL